MRWLRFALMSAVVGSAAVGTTAQASPITLQDIEVFATGTIDQQSLSLVDNQDGTFTVTAAAGTLTVTSLEMTNNIGLLLGGQLNYAGGVFSNLSTQAPNLDTKANLVTFETLAGEFSFSSAGGLLASAGNNSFSDANTVLGLIGNLSGPPGYNSAQSILYFFFDSPSGTYGNASWLIYALLQPAVPEPSTWLLAGLAATGLFWHRRRQRVA